jgi:hypothetical protein
MRLAVPDHTFTAEAATALERPRGPVKVGDVVRGDTEQGEAAGDLHHIIYRSIRYRSILAY